MNARSLRQKIGESAPEEGTHARDRNLFDLTGKTAIITGSTKGIGKAIAEQFAEHGARGDLLAQAGPCEEVAAINAKHKPARRSPAPPASRRRTISSAWSTRPTAAFGKIDILVCNAASNPYYGPMSGITDEAFAKILNNIISNNTLTTLVANPR
jgi:NAD(P)-dependent dehydrogenase (short-subunit alcohol dehydrogenase family)